MSIRDKMERAVAQVRDPAQRAEGYARLRRLFDDESCAEEGCTGALAAFCEGCGLSYCAKHLGGRYGGELLCVGCDEEFWAEWEKYHPEEMNGDSGWVTR